MAKNKKKNDTRTTLFVILAAVLILAAIIAAVLLLTKTPTQDKENNVPESTESLERTTAANFPFEIPGFTLVEDAEVGTLNETLSVLGVGKYSGSYFEDASDDSVLDILAIVVQNTGDDWISDATISMECNGSTAVFTIASLPGQTCAILLDRNRMVCPTDAVLRAPVCSSCNIGVDGVVFDFGEDFSLPTNGGDVLVLRNISGQEITSDALLYYKSVARYGKHEEVLYLGGITYSYRFNGPIRDGEERQASPDHFTKDGSAILYMTYEK